MSDQLPWRGPGPGRPDLPIPPDPMPILRAGRIRKRWRYIGVYAPEVMLCAARVQVGPLRHSFWAVWDREERRRHAHTRLLPGGSEVTMQGPDVAIEADEVSARLHFGDAAPVEALCPSGERGFGWTRKRAGVPVSGTIEAAGRRWRLDARGVDDESAGYHRRNTHWHWSAGVGRAADGRAVAWNLVEGINDPPQRSERGIWLEGAPQEPGPVDFSGLESIRFGDGCRLRFAAESERARDDNLLVFRSRYRHLFGIFSGSLEGGVELRDGFGVMEEHEAVW
ncbi:MAG: DUF2804 domain-containing protein [Solirubrobacterales bacterium]